MTQIPKLQPPQGARFTVIFTAKVIAYDEEYEKSVERLQAELKKIDGFVTINSVCSDDNLEIAVSYWKDLESIKQWGQNEVHREVMKNYRKWYSDFHLEICEIVSS